MEGKKENFNCPIEWWEIGKKKIRAIFKRNGVRIKKEREKRLVDLKNNLNRL
jgi:hypothetical protein